MGSGDTFGMSISPALAGALEPMAMPVSQLRSAMAGLRLGRQGYGLPTAPWQALGLFRLVGKAEGSSLHKSVSERRLFCDMLLFK